ncbi:hypothetical protein VNO78_20025 [Psophocarpus tetragonolobus]|uniref:Uncharacterized protein n=1 Tax=Psophocarpus tetragonolobus TaxID=3891 RepID=A0AAN9SCL7_PSOTE
MKEQTSIENLNDTYIVRGRGVVELAWCDSQLTVENLNNVGIATRDFVLRAAMRRRKAKTLSSLSKTHKPHHGLVAAALDLPPSFFDGKPLIRMKYKLDGQPLHLL